MPQIGGTHSNPVYIGKGQSHQRGGGFIRDFDPLGTKKLGVLIQITRALWHPVLATFIKDQSVGDRAGNAVLLERCGIRFVDPGYDDKFLFREEALQGFG